jgi:hypothetical protein
VPGCPDVPKRAYPKRGQSTDTGVKEFDLKSPVSYFTLLPDELIKTGLSNLAGAVSCGVNPTSVVYRNPNSPGT